MQQQKIKRNVLGLCSLIKISNKSRMSKLSNNYFETSVPDIRKLLAETKYGNFLIQMEER